MIDGEDETQAAITAEPFPDADLIARWRSCLVDLRGKTFTISDNSRQPEEAHAASVAFLRSVDDAVDRFLRVIKTIAAAEEKEQGAQ